MIFKDVVKHPDLDEFGPFDFEIKTKIVVLLGPNGSGKTTMLRSIEQIAKRMEITCIYDDPTNIDVGKSYMEAHDPRHLAHRWTSEGERIEYALGNIVERLGTTVRSGKRIGVLFDKLDSGFSIDRIKNVSDLFKDILQHEKNVEFIILSANSYELASQFKGVGSFYWVPTNEFIEIGTYEEFIDLYFK